MLLVVPAIIICAGLYVDLTRGRHTIVEHAYIRNEIAMISAGASGQVVRVSVLENQPVEFGTTAF